MPKDPPTEPLTPRLSPYRVETRSRTREIIVRHSALLLTPPGNTNAYPSTPPPTIHRPRARAYHKSIEDQQGLEEASPLKRSSVATLTPSADAAAHLTASLKALREYLEAGVLPFESETVMEDFLPRTRVPPSDPWTETITRLNSICRKVKARSGQLDELALKTKQLDDKDKLLSKVRLQFRTF